MESLKKKIERAGAVFAILDALYTRNKTALNYHSPFQLLIATILSAQCTDRQVNMVTERLFEKYKRPLDFIRAPRAELEESIRSTGFYRNKAKSLVGCCQVLLDSYDGKVPESMEEMLKLPGVGRKTANCVLGAVYGVPGIVVDTHVKRVSLHLGFTGSKDPVRIEKDLEKLFPDYRWRRFSDILIYHGREICNARRPRHQTCPVKELCPSGMLKKAEKI